MSPETSRCVDAWRFRFAIVGGIAVVALFFGGGIHQEKFFVSYLFGWFFWFGLSIASALIVMIHHLTGGRWGTPVRRFLEGGSGTLPVMALLFAPILFGIRELYPWASKVVDAELHKKGVYLNPPFFIVRTFVYFAIWSAFALKLRSASIAQDDTRGAEPSRRLLKLSGVGVVVVPLLATFAYIDWIMSLEPKWHSTVFPLTLLAGQMLSGFCFVVIALVLLGNNKDIPRIANEKRFRELGNLILTFVLFWAYLAFSQLLIIYSANKPNEIGWYLARIHGAWNVLIVLVAALNFFVPFLLLLFRGFKKNATSLGALAGLLLCAQLLYSYWVIKPAFPGVRFGWMDVVAPIALGAIWLAVFLSVVKRAPLVPVNDARMQEEMAYVED